MKLLNGVRWILNLYPRWVCYREYKNQDKQVPRYNERPIEFAFVFRKLKEVYPKRVLDVGTGTTALPHLIRNCGFQVSAIDNIKDYWSTGIVNRHYHIIDDDITKSNLKSKFDLVTCVSTLEHIVPFDLAVKNMGKLLEDQGVLIITCPSAPHDYVNNVYELDQSSYGKGNKYITQSFSPKQIEKWIKENNFEKVDQEFWNCWTGKYWTQGRQLIPPQKVEADGRYQLTCLALRKNQTKPKE